MMTDEQIPYCKEFLDRLCVTEADRKDAADLIETLRALFQVLAIAKKMVSRPPAMYSPNSRKGQLQEAIKPFIKVPSRMTV